MKKKFDLLGILLFCMAYRFFYFIFLQPDTVLYNSDSVTYFTSVDIFKGIVDLYRTPLYTYVIKFFEYLSKENFVQNLILFQQAISFLSIIPFYYVSKHIVKNRYLVFIPALFYGCWHYLIDQNININPECLCITGSTFILFLFVKYIENPAKYTAMTIGLLSFFLVMLKPTYLILLGVIFVFFVVRFLLLRDEKKILYFGLLGWFIALLGVLGYCEMNHRYNGEFVLSNILLNNTLAHISYSGAYRDGEDKEFIAIIDATGHQGFYTAPFILNNGYIDNYARCYKKFPQYLPPTGDMLYCSSIPDIVNYSSARIRQFVKKSKHTMIYRKYMISRTMDIILAYGNFFILFILESMIIICAFFQYKKIAWAPSLCILFVVGQFFTIIIGGVDNLDRLLIPSYPFIIQIAASLLGISISSINIKKLIKEVL